MSMLYWLRDQWPSTPIACPPYLTYAQHLRSFGAQLGTSAPFRCSSSTSDFAKYNEPRLPLQKGGYMRLLKSYIRSRVSQKKIACTRTTP